MTIDEWMEYFRKIGAKPDGFVFSDYDEADQAPPALDDGPLDPSFPDDPKFDAIRKFVENFNRNWRQRRGGMQDL